MTIRTMLLAATAIALNIGAAQAEFRTTPTVKSQNRTFFCTGVKQTFSSRQERSDNRAEDRSLFSDPVTHIRIDITNGEDGYTMSVAHVRRSGEEIDRSQQYNINNRMRATQSTYAWSGTLISNPSISMTGVLSRGQRGLTYTETRYDRGQRAWENVARCS